MDDNVEDGDKSQASIAEVRGQGRLIQMIVRREILRELLMKLQVFVVEVLNQLMFRGHGLNEIADSGPEVLRFQQQQLDYEEANLGFVAFVSA